MKICFFFFENFGENTKFWKVENFWRKNMKIWNLKILKNWKLWKMKILKIWKNLKKLKTLKILKIFEFQNFQKNALFSPTNRRNSSKLCPIRLLRVKLCRMRWSAAPGDFFNVLSGPTSQLFRKFSWFLPTIVKNRRVSSKIRPDLCSTRQTV